MREDIKQDGKKRTPLPHSPRTRRSPEKDLFECASTFEGCPVSGLPHAVAGDRVRRPGSGRTLTITLRGVFVLVGLRRRERRRRMSRGRELSQHQRGKRKDPEGGGDKLLLYQRVVEGQT
jgi:hypothetical protein